jgi:hypothetical protein
MFNVLVALGAIALILGIWMSVQVLAYRRMGGRQIGCRGPVPDGKGNIGCCQGDPTCDTKSQHHHG